MIVPLALAQAAVVTAVGPGRVDWSRQVLVVEARAAAGAGTRLDRAAVELEARRSLASALSEAAARVELEGGVALGRLLDGEQGAALEEGLVRWRVTEARYGRSGAVELTAELDLATWLRPLTVARARGSDDAPARAVATSGLVVDARGLSVSPAYAPRLLGPDGDVLFELASLSPLSAARTAPVTWVSDPADPLVFEVAGTSPGVLLATGSRGGDLVLDGDAAAHLRALAAQTDLLDRGRVVVVTE